MVGVLFTKVKSVVKFVQNWNLNPPHPSLQQLGTGEYKKSLPSWLAFTFSNPTMESPECVKSIQS